MLSPRIAVGPQVVPGDMAALRDRGYRSLIVNRPDGEAADQPDFATLREAAAAAGIEARHIPVAGGMIRDSDVTAFGTALEEMPGPVMACCRSGMRSATLWALSQVGRMPAAQILAAAGAAGYDLSDVARRMSDSGVAPPMQQGTLRSRST
ncbi:TIGR01244 family sulfur transferase [Paracoccus spongiarum]|uniref:TIGR01244 family sulfur transferase n=1 Tax=Paracoccus spongiarum TaxID=3064387 RepID=A0ABT9JC41_9RHOB|nr:TIGR01244 family sulfur transferase [Paracoccus sp. 2205BS29-5]MDP5307404.1 TIGR01244 family sulfur transferase [Paracoccus sp. 2205BS29-5]